MIRDKENNIINIVDEPNGHIVISGRSGEGKTYAIKNLIIDKIKQEKRIMVLDIFDSYLKGDFEEEFKEELGNIEFQDLSSENAYLLIDTKSADQYIDYLADSLIDVLKIGNYNIKGLIKECCNECYNTYRCISFGYLLDIIGEFVEATNCFSKDEIKELRKLQNIISEYKNISVMFAYSKDAIDWEEIEKNIVKCYIYQMSRYSMKERIVLVEIILSLLWRGIVEYRKSDTDYVVLDEFQHISLKLGSPLANILRMGRKKELSVILGTQFISSLPKKELNTIKQAGTAFYFRPTDNEITKIAKEIDYNNYKKWIRKLSSLNRGKAVMKGCYTVNENGIKWNSTIICKIEQ